MSEIERFTPGNFGHMLWDKDGGWVRYQDHLVEVERLTAERDKAQAGDDVALSALTSALRERDAAQAEIERLRAQLAEAHERCGALELAVEQADEMKAHAEASVAAEEAETDRVTAERDAAQAEVERLTQELDGRRATNQRVMAERDAERANAITDAREKNGIISRLVEQRDAAQAEVKRLTVRLEHAETRIVPPLPHADESAQFAQGKMDAYVTRLTAELHETRERLARLQAQYEGFGRVTAKTIDQHQRERDDARQQVYRLQQACGDKVANGQGMLDNSRPTDETIWWKAFNSFLRDDSLTIEEVADQAQAALTIYRARWPR